ncbi:MAG: GreA/GreB family elongation factor [Bizionia sp.]|nr:GreA/GreB family elongation factor [Bizionia sp.]
MTIKKLLLQACKDNVEKRITDYRNEIALVNEAIENNDKESEGEDSGNGKLLNDLEKNAGYLNEVLKTREFLAQINPNYTYTTAALGSIVKTESIVFYLSTSVGQIDINNDIYYAISLQSPIGQLLKGKSIGDNFTFNDKNYTILEIL